MTKKTTTYLIQQRMMRHPSKRLIWVDFQTYNFKDWRDFDFKKFKKNKQFRRLTRRTKSTIRDTIED